MAISDAQWLAWLLSDHPRCMLVEATAWSGGVPVTRYFANRPYTTQPADAPANVAYDDILRSESVRFRQRLPDLFAARSLPTWGDLEISNENGERDAWLEDSWDGRPLRLYLGDPAWARSDFRPVLDGVTADIGSDARNRLALKIRDKSWMLNVPAQTALIGGTSANKDQPKPIALGECFNVEPVLVDAATHTYQVHDGAIDAITAVREGGASTSFTPNLAAGTFTLSGSPALSVRCDVRGAKPGGVYLSTCADLAQYLVTAHSALTDDDLDLANFAAIDAAWPEARGVYVRERENLMDVLDRLVKPGYWTFTRAGLLRLGRLEAPAGDPVVRLTADDIRPGQLAIARRELPIKTLRLGYARNQAPQADGLAGGVGDADRALYAAEYSVVKAADASLATAWLLAREPDLLGTSIVEEADAQDEVDRLQALFGEVRATYRAGSYMGPLGLDVGDVLELTHPRFGFAAGELAIATGIDQELLRNRVGLELWR